MTVVGQITDTNFLPQAAQEACTADIYWLHLGKQLSHQGQGLYSPFSSYPKFFKFTDGYLASLIELVSQEYQH